MPPANKPPVSLNQGEILAVVAYLQSRGGVVTIKPDDIPEGAFSPKSKEKVLLAKGDITVGAHLFDGKGCSVCHANTEEEKTKPAPNLFDIGERADIDYIRESIIEPESTIVKGYDLAMPDYEEKLTLKEFDDLVAYLLSLKGYN